MLSFGARTCRREPARRKDGARQARAMVQVAQSEPRGAILVLPTGGGKTFTCVHFTCRRPISDGFKVLWLAQLRTTCWSGPQPVWRAGRSNRGTAARLTIRVVSGATEHFRINDIRPTDNVVMAWLQTRVHGGLWPCVPERFSRFGQQEAVCGVRRRSHSPAAPSYRKLLEYLRDRCHNSVFLGLTATPTYSDESKRGWLLKLFPQGIVHREEPRSLMANRVLAKPVIEEPRTDFTAELDIREYAEIGSGPTGIFQTRSSVALRKTGRVTSLSHGTTLPIGSGLGRR